MQRGWRCRCHGDTVQRCVAIGYAVGCGKRCVVSFRICRGRWTLWRCRDRAPRSHRQRSWQRPSRAGSVSRRRGWPNDSSRALDDPDVPAVGVSGIWVDMPIRTVLLRVRARGSQALRGVPGRRDGDAASGALPPLARRRLRPRPLGTRTPHGSHPQHLADVGGRSAQQRADADPRCGGQLCDCDRAVHGVDPAAHDSADAEADHLATKNAVDPAGTGEHPQALQGRPAGGLGSDDEVVQGTRRQPDGGVPADLHPVAGAAGAVRRHPDAQQPGAAERAVPVVQPGARGLDDPGYRRRRAHGAGGRGDRHYGSADAAGVVAGGVVHPVRGQLPVPYGRGGRRGRDRSAERWDGGGDLSRQRGGSEPDARGN